MDEYLVVTFPSVSQALRFEKLMSELKKPVKLIPVPRVISSSCGIAARLPGELASTVANMTFSGEVEPEKVYLFRGGSGKVLSFQPCAGPWNKPETY